VLDDIETGVRFSARANDFFLFRGVPAGLGIRPANFLVTMKCTPHHTTAPSRRLPSAIACGARSLRATWRLQSC
jgi:hypothetical protein